MSRGQRVKAVPRDIAALGRRIERWRTTREKRSSMPEALWQEATRLADAHGVNPICRHLGLGYAALQKRAGDSAVKPRQEQTGEPAFVEVNAAQLLGVKASLAEQTVLELRDQEGTRLTLHLAPGESLDVPALVEGFWGRLR